MGKLIIVGTAMMVMMAMVMPADGDMVMVADDDRARMPPPRFERHAIAQALPPAGQPEPPGGLLAEPGSHKVQQSEGLFSLVVPMQMQRRGVEAKLVMQSTGAQSSSPDPKLVTLFADAHRWMEDLARGRVASVRELARQNDRDVGEVSRTLPLAFLAPDIVEAVLDGRQPINLTPRQLKRITGLPCRWHDQRRRLGVRP
jgi:hypothetical protein